MPKVQVFAWCTLSAMIGFSAAQFSPPLLSPPSAVAKTAAPLAAVRVATETTTHPPAVPVPTTPRSPHLSATQTPPYLSATPPRPAVSTTPPARVSTQPPAPRDPPKAPQNFAIGSFRFASVGPNGGLRLGRVTRGSLPDLLGLKTGDEIITVNGLRVAEPQQALQAYARLPYVDEWTAQIRRDGVQTELRYALR